MCDYIMVKYKYECSNCGDSFLSEIEPNYCPFCGEDWIEYPIRFTVKSTIPDAASGWEDAQGDSIQSPIHDRKRTFTIDVEMDEEGNVTPVQ